MENIYSLGVWSKRRLQTVSKVKTKRKMQNVVGLQTFLYSRYREQTGFPERHSSLLESRTIYTSIGLINVQVFSLLAIKKCEYCMLHFVFVVQSTIFPRYYVHILCFTLPMVETWNKRSALKAIKRQIIISMQLSLELRNGLKRNTVQPLLRGHLFQSGGSSISIGVAV